jgi:hypothetical protein
MPRNAQKVCGIGQECLRHAHREQQGLVLMISGKPGFCPASAAK